MKTYRRILIPIVNRLHSNGLLHTLRETVADQHAQVIVLRLVEYNSGFAPDGPAANLPEEIASRRAVDAKRLLDLQLAQMGLDWVETQVVWRDLQYNLMKLVGDWRPDLIIVRRGTLTGAIPDGIDVLQTAGSSFFDRLSDTFVPHVSKHA